MKRKTIVTALIVAAALAVPARALAAPPLLALPAVGLVAGMMGGKIVGSSMGIAAFGTAISGKVPMAVAGGLLGASAGAHLMPAAPVMVAGASKLTAGTIGAVVGYGAGVGSTTLGKMVAGAHLMPAAPVMVAGASKLTAGTIGAVVGYGAGVGSTTLGKMVAAAAGAAGTLTLGQAIVVGITVVAVTAGGIYLVHRACENTGLAPALVHSASETTGASQFTVQTPWSCGMEIAVRIWTWIVNAAEASSAFMSRTFEIIGEGIREIFGHEVAAAEREPYRFQAPERPEQPVDATEAHRMTVPEFLRVSNPNELVPDLAPEAEPPMGFPMY